MNAYAKAAAELREIHAKLAGCLASWHEWYDVTHRDLKLVAPGIWIHKDYQDLSECLHDLQKMIP